MSDTPRTDAACCLPSNNWETTAVRLCECSMVLERENTKLRSLLQQMVDVAENCDETGYVTDVGFVDIDKLHGTVREAIK